MSLITEYISRRLSPIELEKELLNLISNYNKLSNAFLFVYVGAIMKRIPDVALNMDDYYIICDIFRSVIKEDIKEIHYYIETPGGSAEAVEEIVRFLRDSFPKIPISFLISGEAKSAGTILVLGGDEILMTKSGSLGPIDAQMRVGRSTISAYDYMKWVKEKQNEASMNKSLNPFDATMIAQISPGEIEGVNNALEFAKDLVCEWLCKYKFKKWNNTETTRRDVTEEMKRERAQEIASELSDHEKWRSHGRSLKIDDLRPKLKIKCVDDNQQMADIVYRIQTVITLLFQTTTAYKIFATEKEKIFKQASSVHQVVNKIPKQLMQQQVPLVEINQICSKCGKMHKLYAKFLNNPQIEEDMKKKGLIPVPKDGKLICECCFEMNIAGILSNFELQTGKKIIF